MKLGIMQPYFFPYIGYISLIKHTNRFILLDDVQFMRHGWIERNRILKPGEGWQYISVPLKKYSSKTLIKDVKINHAVDWRSRIIRQLEHYRKRAPYFNQTINIVENALSLDTDSITEINKNVLITLCKYLGVDANISVFSDLEIAINKPNAPDEWALNICKSIGEVTEYRNPMGGQSFFDKNKYSQNGINLAFHNIHIRPYQQFNNMPHFESDLSIIDVMMFNHPDKINGMLDDYSTI